jgi:DNA-binding protein YbaB
MLHYRDAGYDPDAMLNFMARLGWGPRVDDKTTKLLPRERMLELFWEGGKMRSSPANIDLRPSALQECVNTMDSQEYEGSAGAGIVKVVMSGMCDVKSVKIDRALCAKLADDPEFVEDLIAAACRDAAKKAHMGVAERMQ